MNNNYNKYKLSLQKSSIPEFPCPLRSFSNLLPFSPVSKSQPH